MKIKLSLPCLVSTLGLGLSLFNSAWAAPSQEKFPCSDLGAKVTAQYSGSGLAVGTDAAGVIRLECAFQKLAGEVTAEGLWLRSTAGEGSAASFRVVADGVGRTHEASAPMVRTGSLELQSAVARLNHAGLTEEYSVTADGVRQDFLVAESPAGRGDLRLELQVSGAQARAGDGGVELVVSGGRRVLAYDRLRVTDATGQELDANLSVLGENRLAICVKDGTARYPLRIDPTYSDADWSSFSGIPGAGSLLMFGSLYLPPMYGSVYAVAPASDGTIYVGGNFNAAGQLSVSYIAKWDGTTWSRVGKGVNGSVNALAWAGTNLYVGGSFTTVTHTDGAVVSAARILRWDGANWWPVGRGLNGSVYALAVSGSNLYVGGSFTTATNTDNSKVLSPRVARWDGKVWSGCGGGLNGTVYALGAAGESIIAGGSCRWATNTTGKAVPACGLAQWDGTGWYPFGGGVNKTVYALAGTATDLCIGGDFTGATNTDGSTVQVARVARWDGNGWAGLGGGVDNAVYALAREGSELYVGGDFIWATNADSVAVGAARMGKWNGSSWAPVGWGMNERVAALATLGTNLYAGGAFYYATNSGSEFVGAIHFGRWDGTAWAECGSGGPLEPAVDGLAVLGSDVYACGFFPTMGPANTANIARWTGSSWRPLGRGVNGGVSAMATLGTNLYAGGRLTLATRADGTVVPVAQLARWDGTDWWPVGRGLSGPVYALVVSGSDLYVGGSFLSATNTDGSVVKVSNVAQWDGARWSPLGQGVNSTVTALAVSGSDVYASGFFTAAFNDDYSTVNCAYVMRWDGRAWSALGKGTSSFGSPLAIFGGSLYTVCRMATNADLTVVATGGALALMRWDGRAWGAASLGFDGRLYALAATDTQLFAGGEFSYATNADGSVVAAAKIARWDGRQWGTLGSGVNRYVESLTLAGDTLYVAGAFNTAGGKAANCIAHYRLPVDPVWLHPAGWTLRSESSLPANGVVDPGETVTLDLTLRNDGTTATTALRGTLLADRGVLTPSAAQDYGALAGAGGTATGSFTFTAAGSCGDSLPVTLQLQDGSNGLGRLVFSLPLGRLVTAVQSSTNPAAITVAASNGTVTPYPSSLAVAGAEGTISHVTVTLHSLSHTWPEDLDALLVGPQGQTALLMSGAGAGQAVDGVTLTFDDTAAAGLPECSALSSGTWRPTCFAFTRSLSPPVPPGPYGPALEVFNGTNPNGVWRLFLHDSYPADDGGLLQGGWSLALTTVNPVCSPNPSEADLGLTIQAVPDPTPGVNTITYEVTVTNAGPAVATGLRLTNYVDPQATFLSASDWPGTWAEQSGVVTASLDTLAPGLTASVRVAVQAPLSIALSNAVCIGSQQPDYHPANNSASVLTTLAGPCLSILDAATAEGGSGTNVLTFQVSLSQPASNPVTVDYTTLPGTATPGVDYQPQTGRVLFATGERVRTIEVPVLGDSDCEPDESLMVQLSHPTNAVISRGLAMGTIRTDDWGSRVAISSYRCIAESQSPSNGVVDAGETVTLSIALINLGSTDTTNLTATLEQGQGVADPGPQQTYGGLAAGGPPVSRPFNFRAAVSQGQPCRLRFTLRDGGQELGQLDLQLAAGDVFADDFDPDLNSYQWSALSGTVLATNYAGSVSGANALWFGGDGERSATTRQLDTSLGGYASFSLRLGSGAAFPWAAVDLSTAGVVFECSAAGNALWTRLAQYNTPDFTSWMPVRVELPASAQHRAMRFRWRQLDHNSTDTDNWALDAVRIETGPRPPVITLAPASQTAAHGADVLLCVTATGAAPLRYQWLKDGDIAPGAGRVASLTNRCLALPAGNEADSGLYQVIVANAFGAVTSAPAAVLVSPLHHFKWTVPAAAPIAGEPFPVSLGAVDAMNLPVAAFQGCVTLSASAHLPEQVRTVGQQDLINYFPTGSGYQQQRTQVIYLPGEVGAAGQLAKLALCIAYADESPMENWTIRMKHTDLSGYLDPQWEDTGWTVVYQTNVQTFTETNWITFELATPFDYDGMHALMVDFSYNDLDYRSYATTTCYSTTRDGLPRTLYWPGPAGICENPLGWAGQTPPVTFVSGDTPNIQLTAAPNEAVAVQPAAVCLTNGTWSGFLALSGPASNVLLRADSASGPMGRSGLLNVGPPFSASALLPPAFVDGQVLLRVLTVAGRTCTVEYKNTLSDTTWTPMETFVGDGAVHTVTNPVLAQPQRYYRLRWP